VNVPAGHPGKPGRTVTIVTYHYVRDLARSRYPEIKGLSTDGFERQLQHILSNYHPIRMEDLISATSSEMQLPSNACLLTFDDGYIDHYVAVFPLLDRYGIQGSFFPPVRTVKDFRVLDVNKIHFVLASVPDKAKIVSRMFEAMDQFREEHRLAGNEMYYQKYAAPGRFDTAEMVFIKRMLQKHLPEAVRSQIIDRLFSEFVSGDEEAFARELYMDIDQIRCMRKHGMFFGGHGAGHFWMDSLTPEMQEKEVDATVEFLEEIGLDSDRRVFSYPYGGHNESLIGILQTRGFQIGLTVKPEIASLDIHNPLALPRLDTNDLPR
jgi:peptidoglycan/xylan/chitin deacetylase (PgdA/CDA1 family)